MHTALAGQCVQRGANACVVHTIIKLLDSAFGMRLSEVPCNTPLPGLLQGPFKGDYHRRLSQETVPGDCYRG